MAAFTVSLFGAPLGLTVALAALIVTLGLVLLLGLVQARVHPRIMVAMILAPAYLAWKLIVQVSAMVSVRRGPQEFGATERHRA